MPNWAWTDVTIENPENLPLNVFKDVLCGKDNEIKLSGLFGITYETLPHFDASNALKRLRAEDFPLQLFKVIDVPAEVQEFDTDEAITKHKALFHLTNLDSKEQPEYFTEALSNFKAFASKFSYDFDMPINSIEEVNEVLSNLDKFTGHEKTMDWYNFNVKTLGTKWTFKLQSLTKQPNGEITCFIESAWSAPEAWMQAVANKWKVKVKAIAEYEFHSDDLDKLEFFPEASDQTKSKGTAR